MTSATVKKRRYFVVEFCDHTVSVLPGSWIFKDGNGFSCYWSSSVTRVKNYEIPNPRWQTCRIERIVAKRDTYEEADKVCYDFQQTSSIEGKITNEEIEDLPSHNSATDLAERRRKCGRRWSHGKYSDDNEDTDESASKRSSSKPKLSKPKPPRFTAEKSRHVLQSSSVDWLNSSSSLSSNPGDDETYLNAVPPVETLKHQAKAIAPMDVCNEQIVGAGERCGNLYTGVVSIEHEPSNSAMLTVNVDDQNDGISHHSVDYEVSGSIIVARDNSENVFQDVGAETSNALNTANSKLAEDNASINEFDSTRVEATMDCLVRTESETLSGSHQFLFEREKITSGERYVSSDFTAVNSVASERQCSGDSTSGSSKKSVVVINSQSQIFPRGMNNKKSLIPTQSGCRTTKRTAEERTSSHPEHFFKRHKNAASPGSKFRKNWMTASSHSVVPRRRLLSSTTVESSNGFHKPTARGNGGHSLCSVKRFGGRSPLKLPTGGQLSKLFNTCSSRVQSAVKGVINQSSTKPSSCKEIPMDNGGCNDQRFTNQVEEMPSLTEVSSAGFVVRSTPSMPADINRSQLRESSGLADEYDTHLSHQFNRRESGSQQVFSGDSTTTTNSDIPCNQERRITQTGTPQVGGCSVDSTPTSYGVVNPSANKRDNVAGTRHQTPLTPASAAMRGMTPKRFESVGSPVIYLAMLKRVLQVVEETRAVALDVQHELNLLKVQFNDSTGASDDYNYGDTVTYLSQPIDSQEELTEFCNKLSNDRAFRKRVTTVLYSLGGRDAGRCVRRMLDKVMTTRLMTEFNYGGRGKQGKKAFKDLLALPLVMMNALRRRSDHPDVADVLKQAVAEHLKHAPKRLKGQTAWQNEDDYEVTAGHDPLASPEADGDEY